MLQMASRITGLWGGACLAVGCNGEFVAFYDWATGQLVQRVATIADGAIETALDRLEIPGGYIARSEGSVPEGPAAP